MDTHLRSLCQLHYSQLQAPEHISNQKDSPLYPAQQRPANTSWSSTHNFSVGLEAVLLPRSTLTIDSCCFIQSKMAEVTNIKWNCPSNYVEHKLDSTQKPRFSIH